jgi:hypothetical protein
MDHHLPDLPPALAVALRPVLPELAADIIASIGREVPDYARPMEGPFGRTLRGGVERALQRFVDLIEDPLNAGDDRAREIYVLLGRGELRAGRRLDALLGAYRLGARLAWERFVAAGEAAGHEPATLYRLGAAIFTYIDAISAESIEGYATEQTAAAGERERRRRALARLLARDDVGEDEVRDLAALAEWRFPPELAALVASEADSAWVVSRLGTDAVAAAEGDLTIAFVADPDAPGRRAQLALALAGIPAAIGPTVAPMRGSRSLLRARAAHRLVTDGVLPSDEPVVAAEHLATLILRGGDRALAADFAARELAPLTELSDNARERLGDTLRAWLDHPGQVQRIGALLHVHPQTVRYRVAQLRELFGDALEDPERRFQLSLALRAVSPTGGRTAASASTRSP